MEENFKYSFAEKHGRILCVKYNESWENYWEYLHDQGYALRPSSEQHWNRQIDEKGGLCECYLLDDETEGFTIGNW